MTRDSPGASAPNHREEHLLVLIVDDNDMNRKLAREVLDAAGCRTLGAATGGEAMAVAGRHVPDVILMDLQLPDMDGTEAARALARGARTARIPVVAMSSTPLADAGEWLLAAGFAGYLEKPFSVRDFPAQVRGFCAPG